MRRNILIVVGFGDLNGTADGPDCRCGREEHQELVDGIRHGFLDPT